jgi:hypothetical protein
LIQRKARLQRARTSSAVSTGATDMPDVQTLFLAGFVAAFLLLGGTLAFVSTWSRGAPAKTRERRPF